MEMSITVLHGINVNDVLFEHCLFAMMQLVTHTMSQWICMMSIGLQEADLIPLDYFMWGVVKEKC